MAERRQLRFRYTLRALLVFITLFAIWCGYHANLTFREMQAAAVLKKHGAELSFQHVWTLGWRHEFVERVRLSTSFEPEVVSAVSSLGNLQHLSLSASVPPTIKNPFLYSPSIANRNPNQKRAIHPRVSPPPGSIERVLAGHGLKSLNLDGFQFSHADYVAIGRHASLDELAIQHTNIPENALPILLGLPHLTRFDLQMCEVTGKDLARSPGSPSLEVVHCELTPVGVEFAAFLARCPKLEDLAFHHVSVNDDCVKRLEHHARLQMLTLDSTSVTDACIPTLERLPSIRLLSLPGDGFSSAGESRLRTALTGVDIRID